MDITVRYYSIPTGDNLSSLLGPVRTSLPGVLQPTDVLVLNASAQLADAFPFNLDYNSGNTIGIGTLSGPSFPCFSKWHLWLISCCIGWTQSTVGAIASLLTEADSTKIAHGERVSAAEAYISPALARSNLDVLVNTRVTKVVKSGTENGRPVFRTVQFAQSPSSNTFLFFYHKSQALMRKLQANPLHSMRLKKSSFLQGQSKPRISVSVCHL